MAPAKENKLVKFKPAKDLLCAPDGVTELQLKKDVVVDLPTHYAQLLAEHKHGEIVQTKAPAPTITERLAKHLAALKPADALAFLRSFAKNKELQMPEGKKVDELEVPALEAVIVQAISTDPAAAEALGKLVK